MISAVALWFDFVYTFIRFVLDVLLAMHTYSHVQRTHGLPPPPPQHNSNDTAHKSNDGLTKFVCTEKWLSVIRSHRVKCRAHSVESIKVKREKRRKTRMSNMKAIYYDYNFFDIFIQIDLLTFTERHTHWIHRASIQFGHNVCLCVCVFEHWEPIHKSYTIINYTNVYLFIYIYSFYIDV